MTFEQATERIIFDDENMIGFSWDIADYIRSEMDYQKQNPDNDENDEDNETLFTDLLNDLDEHDGLVYVSYHPMGSYFVDDLVTKSGNEIF